MKPIILNIKGIKCDNLNCDYKDNTVEFKDYMTWLNRPCPQCGENLLTKKDLDALERLIKIINLVNWLLRLFVKINKSTEFMRVPIEMNGTGKLTFKEIDDGKRIYEKEV